MNAFTDSLMTAEALLRHRDVEVRRQGGGGGPVLSHAGLGVTCDIYRHVAMAEIHQEHTRFAPLNGCGVLPQPHLESKALP